MNYELAKELKDARFPQEADEGIPAPHIFLTPSRHVNEPTLHHEIAYAPTLSELIEACGDELYCLVRLRSNIEVTDSNWGTIRGNKKTMEVKMIDGVPTAAADSIGATPEEAVARLWLAINKK